MKHVRADHAYRATLIVAASALVLTLAGLALVVGRMAWPALSGGLWSFLTGTTWDPVTSEFGALPALYGTLLTSLIALVFAVPVSFGVALFLTEVAPRRLADAIAPLVDLLAAIPSVIYGLWGIFVLAPLMREHVGPFLKAVLGWTPLFAGDPIGVGYLTAGVILAIMITPVVTSVAREVLEAVPGTQREAAIGLGATQWEVVRGAVFPAARSGLLGAVVLGLGRALGETMAVTMVIGNRFDISASLFAPGYTLASVIANEFAEAFSPQYLSALAGLGMVLLGTTLLLNVGARILVARVRAGST
jgi:phosphate transport system permease protein